MGIILKMCTMHMFGASVSELYLLIKLLINIERTVDLHVITKNKYTCVHKNCESGQAIIYRHAAHRLVQHTLHGGHGDGMDR